MAERPRDALAQLVITSSSIIFNRLMASPFLFFLFLSYKSGQVKLSSRFDVFMLVQEAAKEHDSCINNLHTSLTAIGHPLTDDPDNYLPPSPFNLWMAVSLKNEGSQLSWDPPAKVSLSQRHSTVTITVTVTVLLYCYCSLHQGAGPP